MKPLLALILIFITLPLFGNIHNIQLDKIPNDDRYNDYFNFLLEHEQYYNHWQADWIYDISKESLVKKLKECFEVFLKADNKNIEINLLLGDIAHYLYNLNEEEFFKLAEYYYKRAIEIAPNDFRTYWFLANHYSSSGIADKSAELFLKAQELLPENAPACFWEEYAFATAVANMPTHCIYAMDQAKSILGKPSYFEEQLGRSIHNRIIPVNRDSSYEYRDIWTAAKADLITFVSRPLGLQLLIDSTWQINFYNYKNNKSAVTIIPPTITNKYGQDITYTIVIILRAAKNNEELSDFINTLISKYPEKNEFEFSNKYPNPISYELRDAELYKEIGGAHLHIIGIKRDQPRYPGLLLEQPKFLPSSETNRITFYKAGDSKDRFDGMIFYAIMLDACEDIYPEAFKLFKQTFEKQLIIE